MGDNRLSDFDVVSASLDRSLESATDLLNHQQEVMRELRLLRNIPAINIGEEL